MLQRLIATGYPVDNEHDEGQWLQIAVDYATRLGDREIEHLAIRAAYPLRVRLTRPVSTTDAPAEIAILSHKVLTLRRPLPYSAFLEASLDGGPYVALGPHASGSSRGVPLEQLGEAALRSGVHVVRVRARLEFGDAEQPYHSEVRELAPIPYALFDPSRVEGPDARRLIYGPATASAFDVDPLLPSQPLLKWLATVLAARGEVADPRMWTSRYCSELTEEHHAVHTGGLCAVIYFTDRGSLGQMWFRTGDIEISDTGAEWYPLERPTLAALFLSDGRATSRLSSLPALLEQQSVEAHPTDRSLSTPEIVLTPPAPKPGAPVTVTVTVRNNEEIALQNVSLELVVIDGDTDGTMRHFVVDIPAFGSQSVSMEGTFLNRYGLVFALPFIKGHGLAHDVVIGPPLEAPCAVHLVNPAAAPRGYLQKTAGHKPECVVTR